MKRTATILAAIAAAASLASCSKEQGPELGADAQLYVTVSSGALTRATGVVSNDKDGESKVNAFQIFVFNSKDGSLDGYKAAESAELATLSANVDCTSGQRDVYALVNAEVLSVSGKADFLKKVSELASTTATSFEMIGHVSKDITGLTSVEIPVDRFASRVVVKKITNKLIAGKDMKLEGIYLSNVAGDTDYALSGKAGYTVKTWYNKMGYDADPQGHFSLEGFCHDALSGTLAVNGSHDTAHYLYAYPNDNAPADGGSWSARATKLVIKVSVDGQVYYYPIQFSEKMDANKSYEIEEISISRLGNKDTDQDPEDKPLESDVVSFVISVKDWTVANLGTVQI